MRPTRRRGLRPSGRLSLLAVAVLLLVPAALAVPLLRGSIDLAPGSAVAAPVAASAPPSASPSTEVTGPARIESGWTQALPLAEGASAEDVLSVKLGYDVVETTRDVATAAVRRSDIGAIPLGDIEDERAAVAVPASALDEVRKLDALAQITPNQIISADAVQTPTPAWGLDAIDNSTSALDSHYFYDSDGTGVTAFLVDSGVADDHWGFAKGQVDAAQGYTAINDGLGTRDCAGHGTNVAGVIGSPDYGVAKGVRLVPVRVSNCKGQGTMTDLYDALQWIIANGPSSASVVNMSLGGSKTTAINGRVAALTRKGYTVVVAAGNDQMDACDVSPASAPSAITVAASDNTGSWIDYSNYGSCIDVIAPGKGVLSTWLDNYLAYGDGTSIASPHVAGLAARLLQQHPTWKAADVAGALKSSAAKGHITGVPSGTANYFASIPAVPRVLTAALAADAAGIRIAWTVNDVGRFTSFDVTVTDETAHRDYPVTVAGVRAATVFTTPVAGHSYTAKVAGTAVMPSGASLPAPATSTRTYTATHGGS